MSPERGCIDVVAAVICRDDRYLLCRRSAGGAHAGLWEFPSGKVEPGESQPQALTRELREELGLKILRVQDHLTSFVDDDHGLALHFYSVSCDQEPIVLEHRAVRWCGPAEMTRLPLAPADRHCVLLIEADIARASRLGVPQEVTS